VGYPEEEIDRLIDTKTVGAAERQPISEDDT
jgi:hypothetical protein